MDELARQVSTEQVLQHFGLAHEIAHRVGNEIRARCFLYCGKTEPTGDRVLAIKDEDVKRWCCHKYDCPHKQGGNLVGLLDLLLPGQHHNARPRGERFKEVLATLRQIAGDGGGVSAPVARPEKAVPAPAPPITNAPLAESPNERARGLVTLHEKFVTDPGAMLPPAASYFRRRPYLRSDVAAAWRMGYLPRDSGGDKSGGTMRGKIVYQLRDEEGRVIGYCGRDPDFERLHAAWIGAGRQGDEPVKVRFPSSFHRGVVLYGEHRLREAAVREQVESLGTFLVTEGPNDSIRAGQLEAAAVSVLSNRITVEQADKVARWSGDLGNVPVTLLFDTDLEGETGMHQALYELAQRCPVKLAWSRSMFEGRFKDRQPESLSDAEWQMIRGHITRE
ncbi:MAG TPA: hypothetical protein VMV69_10330 [Pirellulales bacterium]|nr:hypothetical protein [Pirellulales bacterium]